MPATRRSAGPIYVEARIRAPMDLIWDLTQIPHEHQRWDARFTRITYAADASAQSGEVAATPVVRFRYLLGLPCGPALRGTGVTAAERRRPDGSRISALRFRSDHALSPLQEGSGYWRYTPADSASDGTVLFVTGYDYRSWRWPGGTALDRCFVRPFVGWLTAWSFDRLRLWAERGVAPERALLHAAAETSVRLAVAAAAAFLTAGRTGVAVGALTGGAVLLLLALVPPSPLTPAARRCARKPARDTAGRKALGRRPRPPRLLTTLENP
ncbi:hypothetical protein OH807_27180 [Kitasatospora sp. NBC_01560]|uniref:hypothetical protein n=1 Tax=Kitasatospora sp. NBC_01560 TaxID=2975965 RepID=UPI003866DEBD